MSNKPFVPTFTEIDMSLFGRKRSPKATVGIYGNEVDVSSMEPNTQFSLDLEHTPKQVTVKQALNRWSKVFAPDWEFAVRVTGNTVTVMRTA